MKEIPAEKFQLYIEWAKSCSSDQVYPRSIAEGFQSGNIYVDDETSPNAVLFWHYCGFGYLSGKAGPDFLQEIYENFFLKELERRFLLITNNQDVIRFFADKKDFTIGRRIEYCYEGKHKQSAQPEYGPRHDKSYRNPDAAGDDPHIEKIDQQLLSRIEGRIIPSFSWDSGKDFLDRGFGYAVVAGQKVAAVAFSAAVSEEEVDIGAETMENFRGQGYASLLADRMCREIISMGKRPVWAHAEENLASMKTALACGFVVDRTNAVIRKRPASK